MSSAFFYGTLLHPDILKRVLGNDGTHLTAAPAILLGFTRHHVKECDYPAIVPYTASKVFFEKGLDPDQRCVRGTVVSGLTAEEVSLLDVFEGDEYTRQTVSVSPLVAFSPLRDSVQALTAPETALPELIEHIEVETYVWDDHLERLKPELWSFDRFVTEKLSRWVGLSGSGRRSYAMVDERRALNGDIKSFHSPGDRMPVAFGHTLLPQFCFHKDYVNLNHGSFGSLPLPVLKAVNALTLEVEANPDKFMRKTYYPMSVTVRERLAQLIGAETDEIVMVPNVTHGINTVLRNFLWEADDVLVGTATTYGAISRTLQYIHDLPPHPVLSIMNLTFPVSHETILENFREHLRSIPRNPNQKVIAIIDGIVSNPGCVLPWEKMVEICREENVWSVVDAAHSIGQQVGINLSKVHPDFWVSSCNKWLYAKRGCGVMYVPRGNQHIIRSSFPTSFGYVSPEDPPQNDGSQPLNAVSHKPLGFVNQFEYNGTYDFVPYLSVMAALDFRETLGGEARINKHCHALALEGGKRLAQLLQTNVMDEDGSLTANMVNVRLPLPVPPLQNAQAAMQARMQDKLLEEWNCFAAVFNHDNKWWVRCSAQVWNELADFEYLAKALSAICSELP